MGGAGREGGRLGRAFPRFLMGVALMALVLVLPAAAWADDDPFADIAATTAEDRKSVV